MLYVKYSFIEQVDLIIQATMFESFLAVICTAHSWIRLSANIALIYTTTHEIIRRMLYLFEKYIYWIALAY